MQMGEGVGRANRVVLRKAVMRPKAQGDQLQGQVHVSSVLKPSGSMGWGQGAVLEWDSPHQAGWGILSI